MSGLDVRRWTTAGHRPDEQFAAWQQMVSDAFVPVRLARPDSGGAFAAACEERWFGHVGIARLSAPAQTVDRPGALVARHPGGTYFVNLPLRGGGVAVQDGRRALTRPGDFVLVDADRPFRLEFGGPSIRSASRCRARRSSRCSPRRVEPLR